MDKIIIDTNVWLDHFSGSLNSSHQDFLFTVLRKERSSITDVILNEILVGALTEQEYHSLSETFNAISVISINAADFNNFNRFSWSLHRAGLPGKYTDASIAYLAQKHGYPVFSFDIYFAKLAKKKIIKVIQL